MKIEKLNDHQIRCTLSKTELEKRDLQLNEIAYGNEKVKSLFRDMMQKASLEFGFEAENVPLMIEVIPFKDKAVVLITKVEEPDELDTRFSRFAPSVLGDEDLCTFNEFLENLFDLGDDKKPGLLPMLAEMVKKHTDNPNEKETELPDEEESKRPACYCLAFHELKDVVTLASRIGEGFTAKSNLYRNTDKDTYILILSVPAKNDPAFYQFCHIASEYGTPINDNGYFAYFVNEHYVPILVGNALEELRGLSE